MSVRAVVFDWGGTLTPWHDIDLVEMWQAYARVYDPADEWLADRLAAAEVERWRDQQASRGANGTGSLDHILDAAGVDRTGPRHAEALRSYLLAWDPHTLPDPDAAALMQALRDRGIKIGVLSNTMWPRWHHEAVFARDGLLDLIDGAVYTSEVSVAKPHRDAFHLAMESVGASPEDAVFVGDRPWDDIHGAQEAGMRAILVPHSRLGDQAVPVDVTPDAVVARLGDVLGIVDDWIAAAAPSPR